MDRPAKQDQPRTAVFLSYSRKDAVFVHRLALALDECGFNPIFDQSQRHNDDPDLRLTAQDDWWTALRAMIAASDVMVFVVTPESAASSVCDDEIAHAKRLGKRVIAILRREIDFNTAPERLRALNVRIDFREDAQPAFVSALDALRAELNVDIEWHRRGARLMRQADHWAKDGQPEALLLNAGGIMEADNWVSRRPRNAPEPGELVLAFLDASRANEIVRRNRQRRLIGRAFVKPVEQAIAESRHDRALRFAAAGAVLAEDPDFKLVPELWRASAKALFQNRVRVVLRGQRDSLNAAVFSPDGVRIATASRDGTARVWDAATGAEIAVLLGHSKALLDAAFSPDGARLVTASVDGAARVWDAATGAEIAVLRGHVGSVTGVSFSTDGARIITWSGDGTARVWSVATWREIAVLGKPVEERWPLEGPPPPLFVPSHDGTRVVMCSRADIEPDGEEFLVQVWDVATGAEIISWRVDNIGSAAFSPDRANVITTSFDGTAVVWDAATGIKKATLLHEDGVTAATFSPDSSHIITVSDDGTARVWETATGEQVAAFFGHFEAAEFSPDGSRIVTASRSSAAIWDAVTGFKIADLVGHERGVRMAAFSFDGLRIVTASEDGTARVWDATGGEEIAVLQFNGGVPDASFSPDGSRIVTASADRTARIWSHSYAEGRPVAEIAILRGHLRTVFAARFSLNGARVVTVSRDQTARVWDATTGAEIAVLSGHENDITDAALSPDGSKVVTASRDNTARVWGVETQAVIAVLDGHESWLPAVEFSPDGSRIVTCSGDGTARVWDATTGAVIAVLRGSNGQVVAASFSPNGSRIATCCGDNTARVWNSSTGAEVAIVRGHEDYLNTVKFSPDGALVVTASGDATARVWDATTGTPIAVLRGHKGSVSKVEFSRDGKRISTASLDKTARVWECATWAEIAVLQHKDKVNVASFSPMGDRIITASTDGTARLWDISATAVLAQGAGTVLAAALTGGVGHRSTIESNDLLMQDAPENLYSALETLLAGRETSIRAASIALRAPRDPNSYRSPTQRTALSGLPLARESNNKEIVLTDDDKQDLPEHEELNQTEERKAAAHSSVRIPAPPAPVLLPARRGLSYFAAIALSLAMFAVGAAAALALVRLGVFALD